jgi:hypothetical protein
LVAKIHRGDEAAEEGFDENSTMLEEILTQETEGRGPRRLRALCYKDMLLMVLRHLKKLGTRLVIKYPS